MLNPKLTVTRRISLAFLFALFGVINLSSNSSAYYVSDWFEGSATDGVIADCSNNAFQGLCNGGADGGGASWRVFSVKDWAPGLDDSTDYGGNILAEGLKDEILETCSNIGAEWLFSFGWDGMYGSHKGYANFTFQIGPAKRTYGAIVGAAYNTYGLTSITKDKIDKDGKVVLNKNGNPVQVLDESKFANNIRISEADARRAYSKYVREGATSIPLKVGAFCAKESGANATEFEGQALVSEGAWKTSENRAGTGWVQSDKSASVTIPKAPNNGAKARFFLKLRSKSGRGEVYNHVRHTGQTWDDVGDMVPTLVTSGNGTHILEDSKGKDGLTVYVEPGEKFCAYMNFYSKKGDKNSKVKLDACATATTTTFSGYSTTSSETPAVGVYKFVNGTDEYSLIPCSMSGCKFRFSHWIKTSENLGTTQYSIEKSSANLDRDVGKVKKINNGFVRGSASLKDSPYIPFANKPNGDRVFKSDEYTFYPGMVLCEKLHFYTSNHYDYNKRTEVYRASCAYGKGVAKTNLDIKVKNDSVDRFKQEQKTVYAKPGDRVTFQPYYDPELQYTYYLKNVHLQLNGAPNDPIDANNNTLGTLFNSKAASYRLKNWGNEFNVHSDEFSFDKLYPYPAGDTTVRNGTNEANTQTISTTHVGREVKEYAQLNVKGSTYTTPSQIMFDSVKAHNQGHFTADVSTDSPKSEASVIVPYNFTTDVNIELNGSVFAAGEVGSSKVKVRLNPKTNSYTTNNSGEVYATKSDAKIRLVVFVPQNTNNLPKEDKQYGSYNSRLCARFSGTCYEMSADKETSTILNESGNIEGAEIPLGNMNFNVPDLDAGTNVCVAAAVYPSTSGLDTNTDPKGDDKWNISAPACFTVYKKPSVQVWGGTVFSAGPLSTPAAKKNNIASSPNSYTVDADHNGTKTKAIFGSFTELALMSVGEVEGFSSGAATGYAENNNGVLTPRFNEKNSGSLTGGHYSVKASFCEQSRLTFANSSKDDLTSCDDSAPGLGSGGQSSANSDRTSLISTFVNMSDDEARVKNVSVTEFDSNQTLAEGGLVFSEAAAGEIGQTRVFYSSADIDIAGNISYGDYRYNSLAKIPKMIIYAKNINIHCNVTRIDAVLIAEFTVDTCSDDNVKDNVDAQERSSQLKINGSVITGKFIANRTYGAATGANSIVPAEIIDYDTTLYLWGSKKADVTETGKLDATYSRELAPKR